MLTSLAEEYLPALLLRDGPLHVRYYQWLCLAALLLLAASSARLVANLASRLLQRLTRATKSTWDDQLVTRVDGPLRVITFAALFRAGLPFIDLADAPNQIFVDAMKVVSLIGLFWGLLRVVDMANERLLRSDWVKLRPASAPVLTLGTRVLKVIVFALGSVTTLQQLGYPVAGLIAGLGIGGLAVALAAQKTLENLLGSVMLSVDQPFRVGNLVRLDDMVGMVESIGLRSTRIRTMARTLVTVPNGKLADMRLEDLSARDRTHLPITLHLALGADPDVLRALLQELRTFLAQQPHIWPDDLRVQLREFSPTALVVEVLCWFELGPTTPKFPEVREQVMLFIAEALRRHGLQFAQELRQRGLEPLTPLQQDAASFLTGALEASPAAALPPRARG